MPQPKGRDLESTGKTLEGWLEERLPEANGVRVEDLRGPKDTGFSSDTLIFRVCTEEAGASREVEMVIRIEPAGEFLIFPEYDVGLQYKMMSALSHTCVPVPGMYWLEEDPTALGKPFYAMEKVAGLVPSDSPPYHSEGWLCELSAEERECTWFNGLDAMSEVHKLQWDSPEFSFLKRVPEARTSIEAQLDYWEHFMEWGMDRSRYRLLERGFQWLTRNAPAEGPLGICWGDARISNQIFLNQGVAAVIDWEMVFIGNPVADLAWFITMDRILSEGVGLDRLAGMPAKSASIKRWEENLSRRADDYAYYEIFAAWRFAVIMVRIFLQMKHYGILPRDAKADIENMCTPILESLLNDVA